MEPALSKSDWRAQVARMGAMIVRRSIVARLAGKVG